MVKLFEKICIKDLELKNRLMMPPMCMYQATTDGFPTLFHTIHYCTRALGGVGLIILEATAVEARGRITAYDLGIWSDSHVEGLRRLVSEIKQYGAKIGIQLAHAGRKCGVEEEKIISCSDIRFSESYQVPKEATKKDITDIIESFKNGARRALEAGFDIIEIHAAHGYLINQFLSPLVNKRNDEYGGSIKNRARFLKEIITSVRSVWPNEKPIMLRVSAEEYMDEGNQVDDLINIINEIKDLIDIVDVSSGGVVNEAKVDVYPGYQIPYAEKIKHHTGLKTIGGGLITNAQMAEEIVRNNRSDLVFIGRELLRNPNFPLLSAEELKAEIKWPDPYKRGKK